ncbi:MAG TPA: RNA-dependent DNA polymerase [Desulfuromonadales bacterium]|nr:RNA-dependent DNA polymerase [Desulfuromonadales bacterium]
MKRHGNLFTYISSFENLFLASRLARKGKRHKAGCAAFENNLEDNLWQLHEQLVTGRYRPGGYRTFTVHERKPRLISAAPYRDRVVHHALCNVIEPIFDRTFIHGSFACRKGKGTHAAVERFTHFARRHRYLLKTDIMSYFPTIDHEILFAQISRKIKCPQTLQLLKRIIDGSNRQKEVIIHFAGDDLFTPLTRRRGIPIGNLTSQFFANIYLDGLDHYVTGHLGFSAYIRYVDDITIFGDSKAELWQVSAAMADYLAKLRLQLHPEKTLVQPVTVGTDHLGYRIFPDYRLLRKDTSQRFVKKIAALASVSHGTPDYAKINTSLQSWLGHARYADAGGLRKQVVTSINISRIAA